MRQPSIKIGRRSFFLSLSVLLALMILAAVLSYALPSGQFDRTTDAGQERILPGTFHEVEKPFIPLWRFLRRP